MEENEDKRVFLGNQDDEVYLKTILKKISRYPHIYIQIFPYPDKLAKIQEYFYYFKELGIKEIEPREKIKVSSTKKSGEFIEAIIMKWEVIPRLMQYRESLHKKELEDL